MGKWWGGMEELNQKFQRLVEIIRERETEKEGAGGGETQAAEGGETAEATLIETQKQTEDKEKQQQRWDF
ncbi:cadherin-4-like [Lates japonicus]